MADSPKIHHNLKKSFCDVPFKIVNYSTRLILSENLDCKQALRSKNDYARDYRGLGELMGFQYTSIKIFERRESPTQSILEAWEIKPDATFEKLIEYLQEMDRHDIIQELIPSMERSAKVYLESRKSQNSPLQDPEISSCRESMNMENDMKVITSDDLKTGECTYYDAFVSYADEDCHFVQELARILESPNIGFKLFIRGRDMLAGFVEHDTNIKLIKDRCRRMLIILSPNFLKSHSCEFQASFAAGLAIEQRKRILIPIIYAPCKEDDIPSVLRYMSKIDFTKPDVHEWVWEKLINSLQHTDRNLAFTPPERLPRQQYVVNQPAFLTDMKNNPVITYPSTERISPCTVDNSHNEVSTISAINISSEDNLKNSTVNPKSSSKWWKLPFVSKGHISSSEANNHSISTSSSATSGFHSQSCSTFENIENFSDDFSNDKLI